MFIINIENLKNLKYHIFLKTSFSLSIVYSKCGGEYEKIEQEYEKRRKVN